MSDQLLLNKQKNIEEFKFKEETENKFQINSSPESLIKSNEITEFKNEDLINKVKTESNITGLINQPFNVSLNNLKKYAENKNPVLDNRYIDNEQGYKEKFDTESLINLRAEFQQNRYKKKGLLWGYKSDSSEMKAIQTKLSELTTNMYEKQFSLNDSAAIEEVFQMYRNIIEDCNTYLDSSKKGRSKIGKLRKSMVSRIRTTCMRELNILPDIINSEKEAQKSSGINEPVSFTNLLRKARSIKLNSDDNNKIDFVGGSQSTVIKYKQNDKTFFFKEDETHKKQNNDTIINTLLEEQKTLITAGTIKEEDCKQVTNQIKSLFKALDEDVKSGIISEDYKQLFLESFDRLLVTKSDVEEYNDASTEKEKKNALNIAITVMEKNIINNSQNKEEITDLFKKGKDFHFFDYLKNNVVMDMLKNKSMLEAYVQSFKVVKKTAFSDWFLSNVVKLPEGAKITTNNVATSRLAEKLQISDSVAKSQSAIINLNGKTLVGNVMEEAKGGYLGDVKTKNSSGLTSYYSGNAKKQLMNLSIFDYIMGQIDRHRGNFFVNTEKINNRTVITGVKAIDNDACCGLLKPKDLTDKLTANRMSRIVDEKGNVLVPYMDMNFASNVLSLTVEELSHEMIDLLSKEQIAAMAERLKSVQNLIVSEMKKAKTNTNKMKFISGNQWDKIGETKDEKKALIEYNSLFFSARFQFAENNKEDV